MTPTTKKTIKYLSLFIILILVVGFFIMILTSGEKTSGNNILGCINSSATNFNPNANQDDGSCQYNQEVDNTALFLIGLILVVLMIGTYAYTKTSPKFQNILSDDKAKDYARNYLIEKHNFRLQNNKGALYYYYPYYSAGNKNLPRALVCFNQNSDRTNTEPQINEIITVDVNRKDPERDTALFPPMDFISMMKLIQDIKSGKTGESISPVKQQKQVFSEVEMEAIEETRKDNVKEALKNNV